MSALAARTEPQEAGRCEYGLDYGIRAAADVEVELALRRRLPQREVDPRRRQGVEGAP